MLNNKLAKAVRLAIAFGGASTAVFAANVNAAEEQGVEEVERIEVTGSRIRRTDLAGDLPITVIDRETIELSGEASAADLLRNTTVNSLGSFRPQSGSSAQGVSQISLRGLGADRTLVLVDGRRLPKSTLTGSTQDLNAIPIAAIERIEILTDGASAIYGSDAIGGVVNVITRKDFNGAEIQIGAGRIEHEGGDRENGSVVFGAASDNASVLAGAAWSGRDIIFARDLPWYSPGGSVYSNNFTTIAFDADGNPAGSNFDFRAIPGGCEDLGVDQFYPIGARCGFNFASVSADEASIKNRSAFIKGNVEINDDWSVFTNINIAQTKSFGRYAPSLDTTGFDNDAYIDADSPNNPTNPNSPLYDPSLGLEQQPVDFWHRFAALGNRDNNYTNDLKDIVVGANGNVGNVFIDFGVRKTINESTNIGTGYVLRGVARQYINDGTYNLADPYGASEEVRNAMTVTTSRVGKFNQEEAFANVQFDILETNAGMITAFVGAEYRTEDYADQYDSLSEAGQVGGSSGSSAAGDRSASAVFFEALVPVIEDLEINLAGRYDDYSDYGADFSPKFSIRYSGVEDLVLRASWGEGFRAPSLPDLNQKPAESADSVTDPESCLAIGSPADCSLQINALVIANPNLESENSESISAGIVWSATDFLDLEVDYYNIEVTNRIRGFSSQAIIDADRAGDPLPPAFTVTRAPNGAITQVVRGFGNDGILETSGLDLKLATNFDLGNAGSLRNNITASYIIDYSTDGGRNFVKDPGVPQYRASVSTVYNISDFDFAWNINIIGDQYETIVDGEGEGEIPTWVTNDIQFGYNAPWNGKFTLGAQNVGGKQPPLYPYDGRDYNFNLYNGYGRIVYFNYKQNF